MPRYEVIEYENALIEQSSAHGVNAFYVGDRTESMKKKLNKIPDKMFISGKKGLNHDSCIELLFKRNRRYRDGGDSDGDSDSDTDDEDLKKTGTD